MGLLDDRTIDLAEQDVTTLRTLLFRVFTEKTPIKDISKGAGVAEGLVTWDGNAWDMWASVLEQAARAGRLRALLEVLHKNPQTAGNQQLLELIDRLRTAEPALPATFDIYSLGLLPARRSFIDRSPLRAILRDEFGDDDGSRVAIVKPRDGVRGVSHSWHLINIIGRRTNNYDAYRVDLTDAASAQTPRQVFAEICQQLGWVQPAIDETAQPDTTVRLLVQWFKGRARQLPRPTCLVFDGFNDQTADEHARKLVIRLAAAVNQDEAGDVRVVLLEVDSPLTTDLTLDAVPEDLETATVEHLKDFFRSAAAARGEAIDEPAGMAVLLAQVLDNPEDTHDLDLSVVGPKAARVASKAFGGQA